MADGTLKVGTITTSSGSGTITLGQSGETITIPTGTTVSGAMSNKPSFSAWLSSDFSLPNNVQTLIPFDVVYFNNDNCFNTSTNRFVAPSAGLYYFFCTCHIDDLDDGDFGQIWYYKNGSNEFTIGGQTRYFLNQIYVPGAARIAMPVATAVMDLEKDDYVQPYARQSQGADQILSYEWTYFTGFKLIG